MRYHLKPLKEEPSAPPPYGRFYMVIRSDEGGAGLYFEVRDSAKELTIVFTRSQELCEHVVDALNAAHYGFWKATFERAEQNRQAMEAARGVGNRTAAIEMPVQRPRHSNPVP
jgi:hypothetical protein